LCYHKLYITVSQPLPVATPSNYCKLYGYKYSFPSGRNKKVSCPDKKNKWAQMSLLDFRRPAIRRGATPWSQSSANRPALGCDVCSRDTQPWSQRYCCCQSPVFRVIVLLMHSRLILSAITIQIRTQQLRKGNSTLNYDR
jgi:hypothetical protein